MTNTNTDIPLSKEELERQKNKEEKAKEKEVKKLKAAQKAEAAKLKAQEQGPIASTKASKKKSVRTDDGSEENPQDFIDPETPSGHKKKLSQQMAIEFSPAAVEKSWYEFWEQSGFFEAKSNSSKPPFTMVLPPPNITGNLHLGHALTVGNQDPVIRYKRMSGHNTLWVPGMDHAGIATQVVVEKKIMRERNMTRHDLGRDKFVEEVRKWKEEYGGTILKQLKRLGASLDWSRERFTMDEKSSNAVTEAFVRLYKEGLIYRDLKLVKWDCVLRTAVSDIEVEYEDIKEKTHKNVPGYENTVEFGVLTSFAYPLEENLGEIVVATTRIETMLGDTAIAVHPKDPRYTHLHGKFAIHPFNGRRLPIICDDDDDLVDRNFGTGAVKITPAHDPKDFEAGKRHKLEFINIFTDDGKIHSNGGSEFVGMPRFEARVAVIEALKSKGLYRGEENNEMRLGICSRSNDVIEPMIKPQWYVKCDGLAKEALDAVNNKKIQIFPTKYTAEWKRWLENIRDWCVSRQLWWGHRVPAWYVTLEDDELKELGAYNDHWVVARNEKEAEMEAKMVFSGKIFQINQDPDVLDTWFSSGLFPLSVLGWPDITQEDFKTFYPTTSVETGHDILFFWVARMVMLGIKLTGHVPFQNVYLHPMIRDRHGEKMSKSKGNVVDPIEVIDGITLQGLHKRLEEGNLDITELNRAKQGHEKDFPDGIPECGADALRFALLQYTDQDDNIKLDIKQVVAKRQWCNKLWNAVRFALAKLGDDYTPPDPLTIDPKKMPLSCQWILSVLNKAISKTVSCMDSFKISDASKAVYNWWHKQLCKVFLEVIKPCFYGDDAKAKGYVQYTLWVCLDTGVRLLHPFMPFITEELWQRLPSPKHCEKEESIMISKYPSVVESWTNEEVEYEMKVVQSASKSLRLMKKKLPKQERNQRLEGFAVSGTEQTADILRSHEVEVSTLAGLSSFEVVDGAPAECGAVSLVNEYESLSVYLKLPGAIDVEKEHEKLNAELTELQKKIDKLKKAMSAKGYEDKVRKDIKDGHMAKLTMLMQQLLSCEEATQHLEQQVPAKPDI